MITLRRIASGLLWLLAVIGVLCGLIWGATMAGYIKPLVVISGSMEPGIMTGDLLVATPVSTSSLEPGDVVSLHSEVTGALVTHRILAIDQTATGYAIQLKGDANKDADPTPYDVGETVWKPTAQLAGMGTLVTRMTTPSVVFPMIVGLFALLGLVLFLPAPPARERRRGTSVKAAHSTS